MAGFAVQVWVLCVIAFLLGSGVTWLLFVRPLRARATPPPEEPPGPAPAGPAPARRIEPFAPPAEDPALAVLNGTPRRVPQPGRRAAGALDLLGVTRQAEPPDAPPRG